MQTEIGLDSFEHVGRKIRRLRIAKGLSQKAFGPVKQNYIASVETGKITVPSVEKLRDIAVGLGMSLEQLIADTTSASATDVQRNPGQVWCSNKHCPGADRVMHQTDHIMDPECKDPAIIDRSPYLVEYEDCDFTVGIRGFPGFPAMDSDGNENRFCPFCGSELTSKCRFCGRSLYSGSQRFCMSCGKRVWGDTDAQEASA